MTQAARALLVLSLLLLLPMGCGKYGKPVRSTSAASGAARSETTQDTKAAEERSDERQPDPASRGAYP